LDLISKYDEGMRMDFAAVIGVNVEQIFEIPKMIMRICKALPMLHNF